MPVDISEVLHVLAHELRTPAGIAQGYIRLLLDNRIPEGDDRRKAFEQTQKALARISELTHEASAVATLFDRTDRGIDRAVDARALLDRAVQLAAVTPTPHHESDVAAGDVAIRTFDEEGFVEAIAIMIRVTARELRTRTCTVAARRGDGVLDVRVGDAEHFDALGDAGSPDAEPIGLERGGVGLALVRASLVLEGHRVQCWTVGAARNTLGIRIPLEERLRP